MVVNYRVLIDFRLCESNCKVHCTLVPMVRYQDSWPMHITGFSFLTFC